MAASLKNSDISNFQEHLSRSLDDIWPELSLLYKSLINCLSIYDSNREDARIVLCHLCHAARELMDAAFESFEKTDLGAAHNDEVIARQNLLLQAKESTLINLPDESSKELCAIEKSLALALKHYASSAKNREAIIAERNQRVVSRLGDASSGSSQAWGNLRNSFVKYVHVRHSNSQNLPSCEEIKRDIETLESFLVVKVGLFTEAKQKVIRILEAANDQDNGAYKHPEPYLVKQALALFGDVNVREVFFTKLNNPLWVKPLTKIGAYASAGILDNKMYAPWPEGVYLCRMASSCPEDATNAFLSITDWTNPYITDCVIDSLPLLPLDCAAKLVSRLTDITQADQYADSYRWVNDSLIPALLELSTGSRAQKKASRLMLHALFVPRRPPSSDSWGAPIACVPKYHYGAMLSDVLKDFDPKKQYLFVYSLLKTFANTSKPGEPFGAAIWISSVPKSLKEADEADAGCIEVLIAKTVDSLLSIVKEDPDFLSTVMERDDDLMKRSAVVALTIRAEQEIAGNGQPSQEIARLMQETINSDLIFDYEFDPELLPLIRLSLDCGIEAHDLWDHLSSENDTYYHQTFTEYASRGYDEEDARVQAKEMAVHFCHRHLSLIGGNRLPQNLLEDLQALEKERGAAVFHDEHIWTHHEWSGPTSPLSTEAMRGIGAPGLLDHLASWHPKGSSFNAPSHEGQSRELRKLIKEDPYYLECVGSSMMKLRPIYCRGILEGWQDAVKASKPIPVVSALDLCRYIVHGPHLTFVREGDDFEDDGGFKLATRSAAWFLSECAERTDEQHIDDALALSMVETLSAIAKSDPFDKDAEEKWAGDNGAGCINGFINTNRSIAIEGLVKTAFEFSESETSRIALTVLEEYLPDKSPSALDACAIAFNINYLFNQHPKWLEANKDRLFGLHRPTEGQKTFLIAAICTHAFHIGLFKYVKEALSRAFSIGLESYPSEKTVLGSGSRGSSISHWVVQAYICGVIDLDDELFGQWATQMPTKAKSGSLELICQQLLDDDDAPYDVVPRFIKLVDYANSPAIGEPFATPKAIIKLARSHRFEEGWWASSLAQAYEQLPECIWLYNFKEELISLSACHPRKALRILDAALRTCDRGSYQLKVLEEITIPVILNACNDPELSNEITKIVDLFGDLGVVDLDEKLNAEAVSRNMTWRFQQPA